MTIQPEDRERWLWELTKGADPASEEGSPHRPNRSLDGPSLPGGPWEKDGVADELLEAYRRDELSEAERRRVEALLVRDPLGRQRLETLAGLAGPGGPRDLRQELLDRFGAAPKKLPRRRGPFQWATAGWLAASVAAIALVGYLSLTSLFGPTPPPPSYDVGISASTENRDSSLGGPAATAGVGTLVTITAVVRGPAVEDVQVALYRLGSGGLERVPEQELQYRRDRRGAAVLRTPAEALVGKEPGSYRLFVAVARGKALPPRLPLPTAIELEESEIFRGAIRLHGLTLHLQTPTSPVLN